ncbi:hypothetical protein LVD17_12440 [Fulvivirga ulvae]|uniref:hypothetical protein n=1 Tax=Fulvivirga ulvae TaxID=2904245 RepID=UPI001F1EF7E3|nr:hypothetical protein [Fulvivirga ulvae]UII34616.1 hypothetical protein LVD17_12440 [Fulvivirga ulvae]
MKNDNYINQAIIGELESLFSFIPPDKLQTTIQYIFFQFLINVDKELLPTNFNQMAADIHYLMEFLQIAAEDIKSSDECPNKDSSTRSIVLSN